MRFAVQAPALLCGLLLSLNLMATPAEIGLLWRVTSPDGAENHLFGTMHSSDPKVTTLAPEVQQAFDASGRVVLELDMEPSTIMESAQLLMYPSGQSLRDTIPPALYRQVIRLGQDKSLPEAVLGRMKPWAAGVVLAAPPQKHGEFLDKKLATMARETGKTVIGLETPAEQLRVFEQLSDAEQVTLLREIVAEYEQLPAFFEQLDQAYAARDLALLLELGEQDLESDDARLAELLLTGLIDDRNHRMNRRLQVFLQDGRSFVAVGALHLPGDTGLLTLLRERGYRVERVW